MHPISVTILAKNSQKHLEDVLTALTAFDEVLIYDNGSTDDTLAIAKQFPNVKIVEGSFLGFGKTHNVASSEAKHNWILSIDSDEVATKELVEEIQQLTLDKETVYTVPRKNYFNGKWIKGCGWYPDRVNRLYNREKTAFSNAEVHEAVQTKGMKTHPLQSPLIHYSYDKIEDFLSKMQSYSTLFAKQNSGKKSSIGKAITHGFFAFFKSYVLKRGFLDGREGFIISMYNGHTAFYKYLKLAEVTSAKIRLCPDEKASPSSSSRDFQS